MPPKSQSKSNSPKSPPELPDDVMRKILTDTNLTATDSMSLAKATKLSKKYRDTIQYKDLLKNPLFIWNLVRKKEYALLATHLMTGDIDVNVEQEVSLRPADGGGIGLAKIFGMALTQIPDPRIVHIFLTAGFDPRIPFVIRKRSRTTIVSHCVLSIAMVYAQRSGELKKPRSGNTGEWVEIIERCLKEYPDWSEYTMPEDVNVFTFMICDVHPSYIQLFGDAGMDVIYVKDDGLTPIEYAKVHPELAKYTRVLRKLTYGSASGGKK